MAWQADLDLDYTLSHARVVLHHRHSGPLRVLQSLYPEGDAVCHNVLVHPPGGLVGGDVLQIRLHAAAGTHALLTTPGATRFYRSSGASALQRAIAAARSSRLGHHPESFIYSSAEGYVPAKSVALLSGNGKESARARIRCASAGRFWA